MCIRGWTSRHAELHTRHHFFYLALAQEYHVLWCVLLFTVAVSFCIIVLLNVLHNEDTGSESLFLERINKFVLGGNAGSGPHNWLELKSNWGRSYSFDDKFGNTPEIKLLDKFEYCNFVRFQNQPGISSEIPTFDMSRTEWLFWVWSHCGKFVPSLQEDIFKYCNLKGGVQFKPRFKVNELSETSNVCKS